jgi:predicted DNA-binding transcriptional regulator YafY
MNTEQRNRILKINEIIRTNGYPNLDELSKQVGVNKRTIQRDLQVLREKEKAPLKYCRLNNGYYYTESTFNIKDIILTEGEMVGLLLAEKLLSQYENTPYEEKLRSAFVKLQSYLPDNIEMGDVDKFRQGCSFDLGFVRKVDVELFEDLIHAIADRRQLKIYYYTISSNQRKWRTVDPYHLKNYRNEWYLAAYCHNAKDIRTFSPIRIEKQEETGESFAVRPDFSPEEYWGKIFGIYKDKDGKVQDVSVWIDPEQSRWIKEIVFEGDERVVEVKNHEDGSMTVVFRVGKTDEIKRWIMQYGKRMKVIGPESFVEEIKREVEDMRKSYWI